MGTVSVQLCVCPLVSDTFLSNTLISAMFHTFSVVVFDDRETCLGEEVRNEQVEVQRQSEEFRKEPD